MPIRPSTKLSRRKSIRIDFQPTERSLSENNECECRQIYEKLERLQPDGVCVNLETLRRALYPPVALSKNHNDQILSLAAFYRQRENVSMPQIRTSNFYHSKKYQPIGSFNLDRIVNQVNKQAAVNYSYYTRMK